jgi:hypothetical protein
VQIVHGDAEAVGNGGEILFDKFGIVAEEQDGKRGTVVDEDAAIAIEHASTRSDDGNGADTILFGHLAVLVVVDDLELPEAEEQKANHAYDDVGDDGEPRLRETIVTVKRIRHAKTSANRKQRAASRKTGHIARSGETRSAQEKIARKFAKKIFAELKNLRRNHMRRPSAWSLST